jgi:hypothetical protein
MMPIGPSTSPLARTANGGKRKGYSPSMLVEESRIFEVVTFLMLHLHRSELDHRRLLTDVMVIADEADAQLREAVRTLTARMRTAVAPAGVC